MAFRLENITLALKLLVSICNEIKPSGKHSVSKFIFCTFWIILKFISFLRMTSHEDNAYFQSFSYFTYIIFAGVLATMCVVQ